MIDHNKLIRDAERHLSDVEPRFAALISRHGSCQLIPNRDVYACIIRSVISQMISTKAAESIAVRVEKLCRGKLMPKRMLTLSVDQLRTCGLSLSKANTLLTVSELFNERKNLNDTIHLANDDDVRKLLLPIRGIGPWTVQMLMIFSLVRPDVWPVNDLGIQISVQDIFGLRTRPDAKRLEKIARPWVPYRTIAAWHLWRARDDQS